MFGVLAWLARVLLILFVVRLVSSMLFGTGRVRGRVFTGGAPGSGPAPRGRTPERAGGQLVRDPQCGTYVAESAAIRVTRGGAVLYFCSDTCREAYAAAHA